VGSHFAGGEAVSELPTTDQLVLCHSHGVGDSLSTKKTRGFNHSGVHVLNGDLHWLSALGAAAIFQEEIPRTRKCLKVHGFILYGEILTRVYDSCSVALSGNCGCKLVHHA
jgi:hypothetical protein